MLFVPARARLALARISLPVWRILLHSSLFGLASSVADLLFNFYLVSLGYGADTAGLETHGCDLLLLPSVEEMYPFGTMACVQMHVPGITDILDGYHRPGHFNGVAQVVARLFNMVQPQAAVFGRKDYQQLQVIRYMTTEMSFPIQIVPASTCSSPASIRNAVVLPEPEGPTRTRNSPSAISRSRLSTAGWSVPS